MKNFAFIVSLLLVTSCGRWEMNSSQLANHVQLNPVRAGSYEAKGHFTESQWNHYFLFRLAPTQSSHIANMIQSHVSEGQFITDLQVSQQTTFLNGLCCFLTFDLYCPETTTISGNIFENIKPIDSDGDSVLDSLDACPSTPAETKVDDKGCPVIQDKDGDGIVDELDKCPASPKGTKIGADGCSLTIDTDGDGVPDDQDLCLGTSKEVAVDAGGCPKEEPKPLVKEKPKGVLKGVEFEKNSHKLAPASLKILDEVVLSLKDFPKDKIEIQGHTDNRGNPKKNQKLSQERAEEVVRYFVLKGLPRKRFTAKGYGESKPIANNNKEAGRQQNRRVEIKWLGEAKTDE